MEKDEILEEIVCRLERKLLSQRDSMPPEAYLKEEFFDLFVEAYNSGSFVPGALGEYVITRWDEKRSELLDQLIEAWDHWTHAWENVDQKKLVY